MKNLEIKPFDKKDFLFSKLDEIIKIRKLTDKERDAYIDSVECYLRCCDEYATVFEAGYSECWFYSFSEGWSEGWSKGFHEGLAQDVTESGN